MADQKFDKFLAARDTPIRKAIHTMDLGARGMVVVVESDQTFVDIITDGDFRRAMLDDLSLEEPMSALLSHKALVRPSAVAVKKGTSHEEMIEIMRNERIRQLPVTDESGKLIDIIFLRDLTEGPDGSLRGVVMAGGFGQRLRPLTESTPKPMLDVDGKPLLERIIIQLREAGIHRVNVTTHHHSDKIVQHFGSGDEFGVELEYVNEEEPLGTAGSLGLIDDTDETFLVMNGDILTNVDLVAMLDFHRSHHSELTVAVRKYDVEVPYGIVECEGSNVRGLREKPELSFFINAGVYLVEPSARRLIPDRERFDMTDLIQSAVARNHQVTGFPIREYWLDIGQHEDYQRAQVDIRNLLSRSPS